ncbi:YrhA family protein [Yersinia similis]|uniref:YrhA family protein n=1 Tax=Yersinia similis TaxID=367190 RepID=UPI00119ED831|nr:YrhA family protein [Yersinia similis]
MTDIEKAVTTFQTYRAAIGYPKIPPYEGEIIEYDFGRKIESNQPDFWKQYHEFLRLSDGLAADGVYFYGIACEGKLVGNRLIDNNDALRNGDMYDESMDGLIVIGGNNTDTFYYDSRTGKWEACDRIGTDRVWESCDSLAELIETQIKMLENG